MPRLGTFLALLQVHCALSPSQLGKIDGGTGCRPPQILLWLGSCGREIVLLPVSDVIFSFPAHRLMGSSGNYYCLVSSSELRLRSILFAPKLHAQLSCASLDRLSNSSLSSWWAETCENRRSKDMDEQWIIIVLRTSEWRHFDGIRCGGRLLTLLSAPRLSENICTVPVRVGEILLMLRRTR